MEEHQLMLELLTAGEKMRKLQRRYFKTREKSDLYAAFDAEKEFDVAVAKCRRYVGTEPFFKK